jgi:RIO-like serine/threonine protein kinase
MDKALRTLGEDPSAVELYPRKFDEVCHLLGIANSPRRAVITDDSQLQGWLFKKNRNNKNNMKAWAKRWFVLQGDELNYFHSQEEYHEMSGLAPVTSQSSKCSTGGAPPPPPDRSDTNNSMPPKENSICVVQKGRDKRAFHCKDAKVQILACESLMWTYFSFEIVFVDNTLLTLAAFDEATRTAWVEELRKFDLNDPLHLRKRESCLGMGGRLRYTSYIPESLTISKERLQIGEFVGRGAEGYVYAGTMDDATPVAIKQVQASIIAYDTSAWWRESEILCRLKHVNCVTFYGFSFDDSHFMFIQGLCHGTLRDAFGISPDTVVRRASTIMLQVAAGMRHLHNELGIVHRDVKPENVLLSDANVDTATMKLTDFGLSKISRRKKSINDEIAHSHEMKMTGGLGTVAYMAPELFQSGDTITLAKDARHLDGMKCDVYSAGIMFSEIAQPQSILFKGMSVITIMMAVSRDNHRPRLPEGLPSEVSTLIQNMWDADPTNRPSFSHIHAVLSTVTTLQSQEDTTPVVQSGGAGGASKPYENKNNKTQMEGAPAV